MKNFKIIFYGTPDFAIPSLKIILDSGFKVLAVVTAPDKPSGRGLKIKMPPVKEFALKHNIKVLQPASLSDTKFIRELENLKPDLQVVVAFRKLPEAVWSLPLYGTINLHASKLPQYRGAAPINWALINGEQESGCTTFFINHNIDTGDILYQNTIKIEEDDTAGILHDKLAVSGAELLLETIKQIAAGKAVGQKQSESATLKKAPKLNRETCKIDWALPVDQVYNLIRGLSPYPAAWTIFDNKTFKIYKASKKIENHHVLPGSLVPDQNIMKIACKDGFIIPEVVQLEGRKKMEAQDFFRGYKPVNQTLGK